MPPMLADILSVILIAKIDLWEKIIVRRFKV